MKPTAYFSIFAWGKFREKVNQTVYEFSTPKVLQYSSHSFIEIEEMHE